MADQQRMSHQSFQQRFILPIRILISLLQVVVVVAVLWQAWQFAARPDPLDTLRRGDTLFMAGRYHDARTTYNQLVIQDPSLARGYVRQGMVAAIRGEFEVASRSLARAIGHGSSRSKIAISRACIKAM